MKFSHFVELTNKPTDEFYLENNYIFSCFRFIGFASKIIKECETIFLNAF